MKNRIVIYSVLTISALLMCFFASADSIPYDSASHHNLIVGTANTIISAVPDVNPGVSTIKVILMSVGSLITGLFIGFFKKRNKKK